MTQNKRTGYHPEYNEEVDCTPKQCVKVSLIIIKTELPLSRSWVRWKVCKMIIGGLGYSIEPLWCVETLKENYCSPSQRYLGFAVVLFVLDYSCAAFCSFAIDLSPKLFLENNQCRHQPSSRLCHSPLSTEPEAMLKVLRPLGSWQRNKPP